MTSKVKDREDDISMTILDTNEKETTENPKKSDEWQNPVEFLMT